MKNLLLIITVFSTGLAIGQQTMSTPPKAKKIEEKLTVHGDTRIDNYFWMRLSDEQKEAESPDGQTQDVLDYLNAENAFLESSLKNTEEFQKTLFNEMVGRIKQDDESVPYMKNGYIYYTRFEEGADYELFCRKKGSIEAAEEIMLNGPEMGENQSYFEIGGASVSPDNKLLVYGVDLVSRREYTLYVKNLMTGEIFEDKIEKTTGDAVWANDNKTLFYTKKDPITLRSSQIYKHVLGTNQKYDVLVFEEKDDTYSVDINKSKSGDFLFISSWQTLSSEYQFLDADTPDNEWTVIQPREKDHIYSVKHYGDFFYVLTNDGAKNFKLMKTPISKPEKKNWTEVIAHRNEVLIEDLDIFQNHYVLTERTNGLSNLRIIKWSDKSEHYIQFQDPAYTAYVGTNPEFNTDKVRFGYSSLTTPQTVYEYDMNTRSQIMLKQTEVIDANFSPDNYISERVFVTVRDGARVPVSIVYRSGTILSDETPLLLYGYGSYGNSIDAYFSSVRLSLLDRGFVFAIAHIRGGQEMGREWYEDGKLLKKKNTFYDFIDCGKYLVDKNYTSPKHLYAMGGSAGGLLMGAIINLEPKLWNGAIAAVPFVDVVSTMLDESIPLTTGEFDEWGNPKNKAYYDYIKSYSPYDNIEHKAYPNLLITTGYWDSQVQYWEPAKWIAKLRDYKTDNHQLFMHCNMDVGHGGASGRFERFKEVALEYAFLLNLEGILK